MEVVTVCVFVIISVILIPVLVTLCADTKDADKDEPKLTSVKKSSKGSKRHSAKSSNASANENKSNDKESVTIIANGSAVTGYEEMEGTPALSPTKLTHAYEDPETLTNHPKQINDALTNGGTTSPKVSVVNETSPASSMRSSRTSGGQPRVVSQDRALPEIPNQTTRLSVNSERSPSTKRALPQIPTTPASTTVTATTPTTPTAAEDEAANHYDQLERDIPAHQIRSKSSESSSVKAKSKFSVNEENELNSTEMIQPDEVTRSSVFLSTNPHEVYSSVLDDTPEPPTKQTGASSESGSDPQPNNATKAKQVKTQYTKVKKDSAETDVRSSTDSTSKEGGGNDPVYSEAPPVPFKNYDADEEERAAAEAGDANAGAANAVNAGAVALVIDNNAQDSGSGYYAVTDEGPAPPAAVNIRHPNLPESYDVLTGRESFAAVKARQSKAEFEEDLDLYESVVEDGKEGASSASNPADGKVDTYGGTELYAEIDTPELPSAPIPTAKRPTHTQNALVKEELYAEIDSPLPSTSKTSSTGAAAMPPDPGYATVEFKGEQTDSAGYAIVKEGNAVASAVPSAVDDDEEDYAECGEPSDPASATPAHVNESLSRHRSDVSDYATVTFNNTEQLGSADQSNLPAQPPAPQPMVQPDPPRQTRRPRREHLYQEIDDVREEKNPPDKES